MDWSKINPKLKEFILQNMNISFSYLRINESGDLIVTTKKGNKYRLGYFSEDGRTFFHENPGYRQALRQKPPIYKQHGNTTQYDYHISVHNDEIMFSSNVDSCIWAQE